MKWDSIETFFLDMDGTLLDLAYDNYFWHKHIPKVYAKKNNINSAYDLGYEQQVNLFKKIREKWVLTTCTTLKTLS